MLQTTEQNRSQIEAKLQSIIDQGRVQAQKGLEQLQREYSLRHDFIVKPAAVDIDLAPDANGVWKPVIVHPTTGRQSYEATPFARNQLLAHASIPQRFAETLTEHGLGDLLRENLRRLLPETAPSGLLVREVGGTVKGVLSSAYKRMDASPTFSDYLEQSLKLGYVPRYGSVTETRAIITFVKPEITDLGDLVIVGHSLRTSDYGNGGLELDAYLERLWCLNGAMTQDLLRKVHLGRRFEGEGEVIALSQHTIDLDTRTVRSALKDVLRGAGRQLEGLKEALRERIGGQVDLPKVLESLKKKGLKAATIEKVKMTYDTELPVEALPQAPGLWRLSNALSLLAKGAEGDEAISLMDAAGDVLGLKAA